MNCPSLTAPEFREQIRRNFGVKLSPSETGALMSLFDSDGDGTVDCKEFMYAFFRIGRSEKDRHYDRQARLTVQKLEEEKARLKAIDDKFDAMAQAKLEPATEDDFNAVYDKFRRAAMTYDMQSMFNNMKKSFESSELNPTQFKEMLKANFAIHLSPGELDAAVKMFDLNCDGTISCVEFTSTFFKIQLTEKSSDIKLRKDEAEVRRTKEVERIRAKTARALERVETSVSWPILPLDEGEQLSDDEEVPPPPPTLPSVVPGTYLEDRDASLFQDMGSLTLDSSLASTSRNASTTPFSRRTHRKTRKPSMLEVLSPHKILDNIPHQDGITENSISSASTASSDRIPFISYFPKASQDAKDFIMELEAKEKALRKMERKQRKMIQKQQRKLSVFQQSLLLPKINHGSTSMNQSFVPKSDGSSYYTKINNSNSSGSSNNNNSSLEDYTPLNMNNSHNNSITRFQSTSDSVFSGDGSNYDNNRPRSVHSHRFGGENEINSSNGLSNEFRMAFLQEDEDVGDGDDAGFDEEGRRLQFDGEIIEMNNL